MFAFINHVWKGVRNIIRNASDSIRERGGRTDSVLPNLMTEILVAHGRRNWLAGGTVSSAPFPWKLQASSPATIVNRTVAAVSAR